MSTLFRLLVLPTFYRPIRARQTIARSTTQSAAEPRHCGGARTADGIVSLLNEVWTYAERTKREY